MDVHEGEATTEEGRRRQEAAQEREASASGPSVIGTVREEDIEPYTGLRWVGTVFKAAAVFLLIALVGEFVAGLRVAGWAALPTLLGETARTFVFMVVLWGGGDLVKLSVDVGHDIRAQRIFLTRLEWRTREDPRFARPEPPLQEPPPLREPAAREPYRNEPSGQEMPPREPPSREPGPREPSEEPPPRETPPPV